MMLAAAPNRLAASGCWFVNARRAKLFASCIGRRSCRFDGDEAVSVEGMGAFWQALANSGVMNFAQLQSIAVPRSRPDANGAFFCSTPAFISQSKGCRVRGEPDSGRRNVVAIDQLA